MKDDLASLAKKLREQGQSLVAKHPPDSTAAAVGRERLARADDIERGLHNGWKLTVAMTALVGLVSLSDAALPEGFSLPANARARPTISRHSAEAEPEVRASEHTHRESQPEKGGPVVTETAEGARVAWYFGVLCRSCGAPILLFDDESGGDPVFGFTGGGSIIVPCPLQGCDGRHSYGTAEVRRFTVSNGRVHLFG